MAFTTYPYATVSQVKSALDLQNTTDDVWIQELIAESQATLDAEIGYSFQTDGTLTAPAQRIYSGFNQDELVIDRCVSVSQVLETTYNVVTGSNGMYVSGTTQTIDITADCVLGPDNHPAIYGYGFTLKRKTGNVFQVGNMNYVVNGVFGTPLIPNDITRACVRLAIHYYKMRDSNYANQIIEQGMVRLTYEKDIPMDVQRIITRYKKKTFLAR